MTQAPPDISPWGGNDDAVILSLRPSEPQRSIVRFAIGLLGNFELRVENQRITLPTAAQRLVALLSIERRPLTRHYVARTLWPDKADSRAAANLRSTLWRLNNCVEGLIESDSGHLTMIDDIDLDIDIFILDHSPDTESPTLSSTTAGILAYPPSNAELLADWEDEWVTVERERIRQQTLRALENAVLELRELGFHSEAIEAGTTAIRLAPLRESAHRSIIQVHLAEGNYAEAVRQYETFRAIIFEAFGVEPSSTLTELFSHLSVGS